MQELQLASLASRWGIVGLRGKGLESPDLTLVNGLMDKYLITTALYRQRHLRNYHGISESPRPDWSSAHACRQIAWWSPNWACGEKL